MMKKNLLIPFLYIFFLVLFAACSNGERCNSLLSETALDSALSSAEYAVSIYGKHKRCRLNHSECRAREAMLSIFYSFYSEHKPETDSLANVVREHYSESGNIRLKSMSLLAAALVYSELGESDRAVKEFDKASELASQIDDNLLKYLIYKQWGWILRSENPYTESTDKFQKALRCSIAMHDHIKEINVIDLIGWEYLYGGNYDKALEMFADAICKAKRYSYKRMDLLYKSMASAYEMKGEHDKALLYIDKAIGSAGKMVIRPLYAIKGVVLTNLSRYDSARIYIDKGRQNDEYYQKASYLYDMSELERATGNYREAFGYMSLYSQTLDSMYQYQHDRELIRIQKLYNYSRLSAERNKLELENQRRGNLIVILIAAMLVVFIISGYLYRRWRRKINYAMKTKERLLANSLAEIKEHNYLLMQTRQKAQDMEMEMMGRIDSKDKQLDALRRQQQELKQSIFRTNEVIRKIEAVKEMKERKKISLADKIALSKEERENLIDSTNLCYDYFTDRLRQRFADLSTDDLCLCCLLRIGTSTQDVCLLLATNDSTLKKRKYRLKNKKMALGDEYDTLDDFLRDF